MQTKNNCKHFRGNIPCKPHKNFGVHCADCQHFEAIGKTILIIKLGAAGDVIRTTPILHKLRREFPNAEINWLTNHPLFVPNDLVNNVLTFDLKNITWLKSRKFDLLINLDKDRHAIALADQINAVEKKGYLSDHLGKCIPANEESKHKWLTGLFDDICLENLKSYPQEIFEIFGYKFKNEKYILPLPKVKRQFSLPTDKKIIGLNTGCGSRWLTRLWGESNWIILAKLLDKKGYYPLLLGGPIEDEMNKKISENSPANYLGFMPMDEFLVLMNHCDLVVTSVTMAMHVAIAYKKKLVLLNNIFNAKEFYLYDLGTILEPTGKDCLGCYKNSCPIECMSTISPERVINTLKELL